ncbi:MAG: hypothetical protein JWR18_3319 [Segetibacter sp.]|jgi:adenylate cyclase|nr:hypothetical protein [Segetibacter sp.]
MDLEKTCSIEFIGEKVVPIKEGQTILGASLQAGIPHFHACRGMAQCSTCRVLVAEGLENLSPPNEKEKALRMRIPGTFNTRLACQTTLQNGSVRVHRVIRDQTDVFVYVGKADEEDEDQELGEERELALFFLDIRNFTPFVASSLPFDVMHIIRRLFRIFKKAIAKHQGNIIDTAGDGFYAVFGLKTDITSAANAAITAGFAIHAEVADFNEQYLQPFFNVSFHLGIGIHTGKVVVGNAGVGMNNNLTAMGLPVNIASRLQAATKALNNSFIVSETAAGYWPTAKEYERQNIELKGIDGEQSVYLFGEKYY